MDRDDGTAPGDPRGCGLPRTCDVAVVGAGAMGLFTALFLARAGHRVVVIERGSPWSEASGVNAGSLGVQNKRLELVPFALEALRVWGGLGEELGRDLGFRRSGGYRVATTEPEREVLVRTAEQQRERGVRIEQLGANALAARAPHLSSAVIAANFSPDDAYANPLLVGPALVGAAQDAGVTICSGTELNGVRGAPEGIEVSTGRGTLRCGALVLACGAWIDHVTRLLDVRLPVSLDVNMVSVTEPAPPVMQGIVMHARGVLTLKQSANGSCLIGGGWKGRGDLATGTKGLDYESFLHNLRLAVRVVPALARLNLVRQWCGFEGVTPDSLPIFGRLPGHSNVFVSACARGGWTLSPVFGRLMAELVCKGETSLDVSRFSPGRFSPAERRDMRESA